MTRDTVYSVTEGYVTFYTTGCLLPPRRSPGKTLVSLCPASSCTPRQTCLSLLKCTESSKNPRSFGISRGTEASPAAAPADTSVCCPPAARSRRKGRQKEAPPGGDLRARGGLRDSLARRHGVMVSARVPVLAGGPVLAALQQLLWLLRHAQLAHLSYKGEQVTSLSVVIADLGHDTFSKLPSTPSLTILRSSMSTVTRNK